MSWRRPGLLARLALALALVGLLPVAFATRSLVGVNVEALTRQAERLQVVAARTTAESIDSFLEGRIGLAAALALDGALSDPGSPAAQEMLRRTLGAWGNTGVLAVAIVTPTGDEVIRAQLPSARDLVPAALAPATGERVVLTSSQGEPVVRIEIELAAGGGLLWLICDGGEVVRALENYQLEDEADLLLVDSERRALFGRQSLVDDFPAATIAMAAAGHTSGAKTDFVSPADGRHFIGAWAGLAQAPWVVVARQPLAVAQQVVVDMRQRSWLAIAGALGLIGLASGIAYASVVRPIREVAAAQRRLAGLPAGGGGDEIGQLRAAFDALERRISEQERLDEVFLGRYQVTDVIGSGAMGTVFRGWDPKLERPVALKTVRLDRKLQGRKQQELVERLLSEAVTVARFNHPNIVAVFDVEDHPEGAYVAMELIDGASLELVIWRNQRLPPDQVVLLGAAIARALEVAHRAGIVHRDIKPANVLLSVDGSIKVTDFGISELLSSMAPTEDVVFGTPGFVPPETLRGQGYDESGDLFSMGAVLYISLVGRPPFEGRSVKEVIRRTLFGVVERPRGIVPDVPEELDALIMELLERDPAERPRYAGAIAERLEELARRRGFRWQAPARPSEEAEPESRQQSRYLPTTRLG